MRKRINIITTMILAGLLYSCDNQLFITNESEKSNICISSFFCPDSTVRVKIVPLMKAFSLSNDTLIIDEVKVTNLMIEQEYYLEKKVGDENIYLTKEFSPSLGDILKIEVKTSASDEPLVAIDSIGAISPQFSIINLGVEINPKGSGDAASIIRTGTIEIDKNRIKSEGFYEVVIFSSIYTPFDGKFSEQSQKNIKTSTSFIISEDYYPSKTSIDVMPQQSLIFRGKNLPERIIIDFTYFIGMFGSGREDISPAHFLRLELREVSYAYYQYKSALYKQENAIRGDIIYGAAKPVIIPSNVDNGRGIFAGYNVTAIDTFIEKFVYHRK
jgi:hypothetical protein